MSTEAIVSYATLILADAGIDITSDKILTLTKQAKADVEPVWAETFAKATEGQDLKEILAAFSAAGPSGPSAAAASTASAASAAEEAPAAKEESESDSDMGLGLFD